MSEDIFKQKLNRDSILNIYGTEEYIKVEELYQAFKERLIEELIVDSDEMTKPAYIFDLSDD